MILILLIRETISCQKFEAHYYPLSILSIFIEKNTYFVPKKVVLIV
jgi:hypothetical protein